MTTAIDNRRWLAGLQPRHIDRLMGQFTPLEAAEFPFDWSFHSRDSQLAPETDWRVWLILAGRGFGKTRTGAEWVRSVAESDPHARIALVAATLAEARAVMVEGESGIMACCPQHRAPTYEPSLRRLIWPGGGQAALYSAGEPESLRGPQHSHAWCDEIAKWDNASGRAIAAWDNLQLGLRLGERPRTVATTTPRAVPLLRRLLAEPDVVRSGGRTEENAARLPASFLDSIRRTYGGTALGRQELDGELIEDLPGALWTRGLIEECREGAASSPPVRVVIGVDPPASAGGDACGIVVCALAEDGTARVLADASVAGASPERWARAAARAARMWKADRVIAEANQGGAMVASVLRAADVSLPVKLVHASRGKTARAEPVAALYEAGRVRHAGTFPALEDEHAGQAQKEAFVNEAHALTDALLYCAIEGEAAAPPVSSDEGTAWLVAASATGAWAGQDGRIACRQAGNWLFVTPRDGMRLVDRASGQERRYLGTWRVPDVPPEPSGGSVVDAEARTAFSELVAALREAGVFPEP